MLGWVATYVIGAIMFGIAGVLTQLRKEPEIRLPLFIVVLGVLIWPITLGLGVYSILDDKWRGL